MYESFTIAIPVKNPDKVAQWYKEYLGLSEIINISKDVFEIQIMDNLWIQFYEDNQNESPPLILRFGVNKLSKIIRLLKLSNRSYRKGKPIEGVRYLYSQENPWGHKIGFYELFSKGE